MMQFANYKSATCPKLLFRIVSFENLRVVSVGEYIMFYKSNIVKVIALISFLFSFQNVHAAISNGDFSSGGTDWGTFINSSDSSLDPSVDFSSGAAVLTTGNGAGNQAAICQGATGCNTFGAPLLSPFLVESDVLTLEFDVSFLDLGEDLTEPVTSQFIDALYVQVWHPTDFFLDLALYVETSGRVVLDMSDFAGVGASLFFTLLDEDDGLNTQVTIDNVAFTTSTPAKVIESSSFGLFLLSFLILGLVKRKS